MGGTVRLTVWIGRAPQSAQAHVLRPWSRAVNIEADGQDPGRACGRPESGPDQISDICENKKAGGFWDFFGHGTNNLLLLPTTGQSSPRSEARMTDYVMAFCEACPSEAGLCQAKKDPLSSKYGTTLKGLMRGKCWVRRRMDYLQYVMISEHGRAWRPHCADGRRRSKAKLAGRSFVLHQWFGRDPIACAEFWVGSA